VETITSTATASRWAITSSGRRLPTEPALPGSSRARPPASLRPAGDRGSWLAHGGLPTSRSRWWGGVTFPQLSRSIRARPRPVGLAARTSCLETLQRYAHVKAGPGGYRAAERERGAAIPVMVSGTSSQTSGTMLAGQTATLSALPSCTPTCSPSADCAPSGIHDRPPAQPSPKCRGAGFRAIRMRACPTTKGKYLETPEAVAAQLQRFIETSAG